MGAGDSRPRAETGSLMRSIRRREQGSGSWSIIFPSFNADNLRGALAVRCDRSDRKRRVKDSAFSFWMMRSPTLNPFVVRKRSSVPAATGSARRADFRPSRETIAYSPANRDRADAWGSEIDPVLRLAGNQLQALQIIDARLRCGSH